MALGGIALRFKVFFFAQPANDASKHFLREKLNTGTNTAQLIMRLDAALESLSPSSRSSSRRPYGVSTS